MTTFASMTARPSHTYGRHHSSSASSTMIQAPQATVEKASTSPITGDPRSSSSEGFVPAQYSMANRIAMNTMALPRSGCLATSNVGTPAMRQGGSSSRSVAGASRRSACQHEDHGKLGELDGLAQPHAPDRDPRALARRRARPRAGDEGEQQHHDADAVSERRRPLEQPGRRSEHQDDGHGPHTQPDQLLFPDGGHERGDVGLSRGVERREPVGGEGDDDRAERPIYLTEAEAHCRCPVAGSVGGSVARWSYPLPGLRGGSGWRAVRCRSGVRSEPSTRAWYRPPDNAR